MSDPLRHLVGSRTYEIRPHSVCWGGIAVDGADPGTFRSLTDDHLYGVDAHGVYYGAGRIREADPGSFRLLEHDFAVDRSAVFQGYRRLAEISPDGLEVLGDEIVRDRRAAFHVRFGKVRKIATRHPERLRMVRPETGPRRPRFQSDGEIVFVDGWPMPEADATTFRALADYYGADARHVFHHRTIIAGADALHACFLGPDFLRDQKSLFYGGVRVPDCDPDTFVLLNDYYGRDRKNAYGFVWPDGGRPRVYVLRTEEPSLFRVLDGSGLAGDGSYFYRWGERIAVEQPDTFETLGNDYTRDAVHVYYLRKAVRGADPASFHVMHLTEATDRHRPYSYGKGQTYTEAHLHGLARAFYDQRPALSDHWFFRHPLMVELRRLENAWRGEFHHLGQGFALIDGLVFIHGIPYLDAPPETVEVIGPQLWRDRDGLHRVCIRGSTIGDDGRPLAHPRTRVTGTFDAYHKIDSRSFALFAETRLIDWSDSGYAHDQKRVFFCTPGYSGLHLIHPVRGDPVTFRVIAGDLGADRTSVFHNGNMVVGADPNDVDAFGLPRPLYFRSAGTVFYAAKPLRARGVDLASFRMLLPHLAIDRRRAYYAHGPGLRVLAGVDPATLLRDDLGNIHHGACTLAGDALDRLLRRHQEDAFAHLGELTQPVPDALAVSPEYRVQDGKVWYRSLVLETADPESFHSLGFGYARDARAVWFGHERLAWNRRT